MLASLHGRRADRRGEEPPTRPRVVLARPERRRQARRSTSSSTTPTSGGIGPDVPSDLEQMPHLLNFMKDNGTLLSNDHTILISHTAGGILSSLTGVYPDRHGQTVSNSYVRTSSTGGFSFPSSFGYWTDPVSRRDTPTVPNMVTPDGANAPAPWVPYTRAGCDCGRRRHREHRPREQRAVFVTGGPTPLRPSRDRRHGLRRQHHRFAGNAITIGSDARRRNGDDRVDRAPQPTAHPQRADEGHAAGTTSTGRRRRTRTAI